MASEGPFKDKMGFEDDPMWQRIRKEALQMAGEEPGLARYYGNTILQYGSLECTLVHHLSNKLGNADPDANTWYSLLEGIMKTHHSELGECIRADLEAIMARDPACEGAAHALLNFKGFLGLQSSRISHLLWLDGRRALALALQSRVSEVFGMDIHPACRIGRGVMLDHGTGIVFGETAIVGDNCTILHGVTLGGTGKDRGDRHPKVGSGVLMGAGAMVLGNITIGDGCKIAAGSVVLKPLPAHSTAAGVPAKVVGVSMEENPGKHVDQSLRNVVYSSKGRQDQEQTSWKQTPSGQRLMSERAQRGGGVDGRQQAVAGGASGGGRRRALHLKSRL